jgi:protein phosphatase
MGGHAGGDVASSLAIGELAPLDDESHGADALDHLSEAVQAAHQELLDRVDEEPALAGMGTTVTALLRTGNRLALAHIGDSRAYLLREGGLVQITKDHTFVQTLVDEGRLTVTEAEHHPQRSVLMRVLSDVVDDVTPDLSMREARIGDRYLLCSDGLSGVVSLETLQETLAEVPDPTSTCEALVQLALRAGAPDNVTCIVADVIEDAARGDVAPFVVGAASLHQPRRGLPGAQGSAAERAAALTAAGDGDEEDDSSAGPPVRPSRRRAIGGAALAVLLLLGGGFGAWRWVASQIFVGDSGGAVAVFNGLPQNLGPVSLSRVRTVADDVLVADLPDYARDQLVKGVPAATDAKALEIVEKYRTLARCQALATAAPTPTPSPTPTAAPTQAVALAAGTAATAGPTPTGSRPAPAAASVTLSAPAPAPTAAPSTSTTPTPSASASPELDCAGLLR